MIRVDLLTRIFIAVLISIALYTAVSPKSTREVTTTCPDPYPTCDPDIYCSEELWFEERKHLHDLIDQCEAREKAKSREVQNG